MKKKIAIVYRPDTKASLKITNEVVEWLKKNKCDVYTAPSQELLRGTDPVEFKNLKSMDLIVSIGGDGTYLRSAHLIQGHKVPILGVNLGTLGFLTTTSQKDVFKNIKAALDKKMDLSPRALISVHVYEKDKKVFSTHGLNDVVIERGTNSQLINISLFCDKDHVSDIKADGLIVSSPTGSTAYNLAAGGPILHPQVKAFIVTAVSPHSLTARPFLFPDDQEIILKTHNPELVLVVDGRKVFTLSPKHTVKISRNKEDHFMVLEQSYDYFKLLKEKLKFGDRA